MPSTLPTSSYFRELWLITIISQIEWLCTPPSERNHPGRKAACEQICADAAQLNGWTVIGIRWVLQLKLQNFDIPIIFSWAFPGDIPMMETNSKQLFYINLGISTTGLHELPPEVDAIAEQLQQTLVLQYTLALGRRFERTTLEKATSI
jgi:hypothetical protein